MEMLTFVLREANNKEATNSDAFDANGVTV